MSTAYREHATDGSPCWCGPSYQQECSICLGDGDECEYCDGTGWVPTYSDDPDVPTLVIHNDLDEADES